MAGDTRAAHAGAGLIDLYVYYRVREADEAAHRAGARAALAAARERAGIAGRLGRRPESKEGLHTWMVSFLDLPVRSEAAVLACLAEPACSALIQGERHVERFVQTS